MSETIRFYWRGREATIPLSEIPEDDRKPLRVRRNAPGAHAPEVLQQLEEGYFVAAAWGASDQILLILCHPNSAKGADDALIFRAGALPRVVLKLTGWDQAPEAARLFLKAFGSEAANEGECVAARRQLVEWLKEHGQAEMGQVVTHFSAFPLGVRTEALSIIDAWRQILVTGQKEVLDFFLREVDGRFEGIGWARDALVEAQMNRDEYQRNRFYCWVSGWEDEPRVLLCLNRATDRRVRGGTYSVVGDRPGLGLYDVALAIQQVLVEVLEPAAAAVGLAVAYPRLGPISQVGPRTEAALAALAEVGDGRWPLPDELGPAWRKFVLTAYRDGVALNPEELTVWLAENGWGERAAEEMTKRFYADAALLGEYAEERQPA